MIASGSGDNTIKIWHIYEGYDDTLYGHDSSVNSVAWSPGSSMLVSGSNDATVKIWNINTLQVIKTLYGHTKPVASVAFSCSGLMVVSGSDDNTVRMYKLFEVNL